MSWDNNHGPQYLGASRLPGIRTQPALRLTLRAPVIPPLPPVCQSKFIPARIVSLASWSKGMLFGPLNMRHAFNITRGASNDLSLTDTDRKLRAPQNPVWLLPTIPPGLHLTINTWLFSGYHPFHS
jgi:hypothetical protein